MHLAAKIFLEDGEEFVLGPGRINLLRAIRELGSLRKAADQAGMSYRWAWGRLNKAEQTLGVELFMRTEEHSGGRPMALSPEALIILDWFAQVEEEVRQVLDRLESSIPQSLLQGGAAGKGSGEGGASIETSARGGAAREKKRPSARIGIKTTPTGKRRPPLD